jgi:very-short-patch-repair endonuclease
LVLSAVTAIVSRRLPPDGPSHLPDDIDGAGKPRADADWRKLLAYYAATQRLDPRGKVDERADQHSVSWQLFRADGSWWDVGELRFSQEALPNEFREALMKRPEAVCGVGYPITLFDQTDVPTFVPALLLPATYRIAGLSLVVELTQSEPIINPLWLDMVVRRTKWQKDQLIEALMPEGEGQDFDDVVPRLRNGLATFGGGSLKPAQLAGELTVSGQGLRNVAGLFLPSDDRFTRGAERDLEEMKDWQEGALRETALWALLKQPQAQPSVAAELSGALAPLGPRPLTDRQYDAADAALRGPLTLIQGPPGTGKSEVILSLITSIVLSGRSVLLASKNHQALDEVEARLARIVGDAPLLTRGRDSDGERDTNFIAQMRALASGDVVLGSEAQGEAEPAVLARSRELLALRTRSHRRTALNLALSEAAEQLSRWKEAIPTSGWEARASTGWMAWLSAKVLRFLGRGPRSHFDDPKQIAGRIRVLGRELAALPAEPPVEELDALAETIASEVPRVLESVARQRTTPDKADGRAIVERLKELEFNKTTKMPQLSAEDARLVLRYRPVWAVSTLSVSSRVPLVPALFDYVIFDEASQCDIASALPLFGRARKAIVVGDPMQLSFIPQLSNRQEHALMDAAGLGAAGRHSIAQSINSLFDFIRQRGSAHWHFLSDQFRSAPEIVAYLNEQFYQGRLVASQDERKARWPDGYKPGLAWHDVRGRATREDGGNVNHAEADAIVRVLTEMLRERHFTGTIGVLSPFNTQVALLMRRVRAALTEMECAAVDLRISTIDKFQGGEADVILFSLVVAEGAHQAALTFYERERRRLNVAISRARALCLVFGDKAYVQRSGIKALSFLAEISERGPRPRAPFESEWERRLYEGLRRCGFDPFPQYPVGSRYLDFALDPEWRKLDVEVDGRRWHADPDGNRKVSDRLRDRELIARGWTVRRFWVHELAEDMEKCLDLIKRDLNGK